MTYSQNEALDILKEEHGLLEWFRITPGLIWVDILDPDETEQAPLRSYVIHPDGSLEDR